MRYQGIIFLLLWGAVACGRSDGGGPPLAVLGEKLFFEKRLSHGKDVACSSCHDPKFSFALNEARSTGTGGIIGARNAPSVINVSQARVLTWSNPMVEKLEHVVLIPLFGDDPLEMGAQFDTQTKLALLSSDSTYMSLLQTAFSDSTLTVSRMAQALVAYLETLQSPRQALFPSHEGTMTHGYQLFTSDRLGCSGCHSGAYYSRAFGDKNLPLRAAYEKNGYVGKDSGSRALGLAEFSNKAEDRGKFRIPSLRNVGATAPYMHDGGIQTLEEVVAHYENMHQDAINANPLLRSFSLQEQERVELVLFLRGLMD